MDSARERINELVSKQTGRAIASIRPESRLLQDLGVYGDDAAELLTALAEEFQVDMSDLRFDAYFPGEPHLLNFLGWMFKGKDRYLPLTVGDLYRIAESRKFSP